jgi:hypothetical protein
VAAKVRHAAMQRQLVVVISAALAAKDVLDKVIPTNALVPLAARTAHPGPVQHVAHALKVVWKARAVLKAAVKAVAPVLATVTRSQVRRHFAMPMCAPKVGTHHAANHARVAMAANPTHCAPALTP